MFVQWIVVPSFADCLCGILPSIGGHGFGVDSRRPHHGQQWKSEWFYRTLLFCSNVHDV